MEIAIEKAIKSGLDIPVELFTFPDSMRRLAERAIIMDPAFWKALEVNQNWYAGEWKQKAMDFCEHVVINGESIDDFFNSLLK